MMSTGIRPSLTVRVRRPPAMEDAKTDFRPPTVATATATVGALAPEGAAQSLREVLLQDLQDLLGLRLLRVIKLIRIGQLSPHHARTS